MAHRSFEFMMTLGAIHCCGDDDGGSGGGGDRDYSGALGPVDEGDAGEREAIDNAQDNYSNSDGWEGFDNGWQGTTPEEARAAVEEGMAGQPGSVDAAGDDGVASGYDVDERQESRARSMARDYGRDRADQGVAGFMTSLDPTGVTKGLLASANANHMFSAVTGEGMSFGQRAGEVAATAVPQLMGTALAGLAGGLVGGAAYQVAGNPSAAAFASMAGKNIVANKAKGFVASSMDPTIPDHAYGVAPEDAVPEAPGVAGAPSSGADIGFGDGMGEGEPNNTGLLAAANQPAILTPTGPGFARHDFAQGQYGSHLQFARFPRG